MARAGRRVIYLAEATPRTADFINGMLRMRVVDEIILYTLPQIAGTGKHFFQSALPQDEWKLVEHKLYDGGVVFTCTGQNGNLRCS